MHQRPGDLSIGFTRLETMTLTVGCLSVSIQFCWSGAKVYVNRIKETVIESPSDTCTSTRPLTTDTAYYGEYETTVDGVSNQAGLCTILNWMTLAFIVGHLWYSLARPYTKILCHISFGLDVICYFLLSHMLVSVKPASISWLDIKPRAGAEIRRPLAWSRCIPSFFS